MKLPGFIERWASEEGDPYPVSLARAIFGGLTVYATSRRFMELSRDGFYGDFYHLSIWPPAMVPSHSLYVVLLGLQMALGVGALVGIFPRQALFAVSILGLFLIGCDRLQYHNNRYALIVMEFLVSLAPCDRRLVLFPRPKERGPAPLWAQRLAQIQVSIIYLASGGSKLLDPDWRGGLVLGDRIVRYTGAAIAAGAPAKLVAFLAQPAVAEILSKSAIATELILAFALWNRRARPYALWWGVWFHLTIQVTTVVDLFTWLTLTNYALFAVPTTRERIVEVGAGGMKWARGIRILDWLRRFEIRSVDDSKDRSVRLTDRDGTKAVGLDAWVLALRTLPLLFPLWLPLALIARCISILRARTRATPREP